MRFCLPSQTGQRPQLSVLQQSRREADEATTANDEFPDALELFPRCSGRHRGQQFDDLMPF
jgi:hypothetical protein